MAVYQARNLLAEIKQHVDDARERLGRLIADWGIRVKWTPTCNQGTMH